MSNDRFYEGQGGAATRKSRHPSCMMGISTDIRTLDEQALTAIRRREYREAAEIYFEACQLANEQFVNKDQSYAFRHYSLVYRLIAEHGADTSLMEQIISNLHKMKNEVQDDRLGSWIIPLVNYFRVLQCAQASHTPDCVKKLNDLVRATGASSHYLNVIAHMLALILISSEKLKASPDDSASKVSELRSAIIKEVDSRLPTNLLPNIVVRILKDCVDPLKCTDNPEVVKLAIDKLMRALTNDDHVILQLSVEIMKEAVAELATASPPTKKPSYLEKCFGLIFAGLAIAFAILAFVCAHAWHSLRPQEDAILPFPIAFTAGCAASVFMSGPVHLKLRIPIWHGKMECDAASGGAVFLAVWLIMWVLLRA